MLAGKGSSISRVQDLGLVVSESAGHLLLRAQDEHLVEKSVGRSKEECDKRGMRARSVILEELEMVGGETDAENLDRLSNPQQDLRPKWMTDKSHPTLSDIRPRLQQCRTLFTNVRLPSALSCSLCDGYLASTFVGG